MPPSSVVFDHRRSSSPAAVAAGAVAVALALSGCATSRSGVALAPHGAPPQPRPGLANVVAPPPPTSLRFTDLAGWAEEDHVAALHAFAAGCGAARDAAMRAVCARARALGAVPDGAAREFFEFNFRLVPLPAAGVLTAYFAPEYEARTAPEGPFTAPVRPLPADSSMDAARPRTAAPVLDPLDLVRDSADAPPPPVGAALDADRATLASAPAPDALAWMRPEDLFFLQIQGSGVLDFPDGRRLKAAYAGDNGRPFVAIARPMLRQGLLRADRLSGESIRAWLAAHAGSEAEAVMNLDPRYVFFALSPDDGAEPRGAAGVPLPPGRAIAVDPSQHGFGELYWVDGEAPVLTGAVRRYRRIALALDTGSAIRGQVRADLYVGRGRAAGVEAGRVRHILRLVRLVPVGAAT